MWSVQSLPPSEMAVRAMLDLLPVVLAIGFPLGTAA
jgi:hypothetical protein